MAGGGGERRGAGAVVPWRWASRARLPGSCVRPAGDPRPRRPRGAPPLSPGAPGDAGEPVAHADTWGLQEEQQAHGVPGAGRDRGPEGLATLCLRWWLCLLSSQTSLSAHRAALRLCLCRGDPPGRGRRCFSAILCAGPRPSSRSGRPRDGRRPAPCTPREAASPRARAARFLSRCLSLQVPDVLYPHVGLGRERQLQLLSLPSQLGVLPVQTPLSLEPSYLSRELRDPPLSLHHLPGRTALLSLLRESARVLGSHHGRR